MIRPDGGNFTPSEFVFTERFVSIPERFPRLKLCGATLAGALLGAGLGAAISAVSVLPPTFELTPEKLDFIRNSTILGGGFGGLIGAGAWLSR